MYRKHRLQARTGLERDSVVTVRTTFTLVAVAWLRPYGFGIDEDRSLPILDTDTGLVTEEDCGGEGPGDG